MKAVRVLPLLEDGKTACRASAFITHERDGYWLYTAWHVVTGMDPYDLKFRDPPARKRLRIELQDAEDQQEGVKLVGGLQTIELDLYDSVGRPLWLQDKRHSPNADLNAIGIFVPFWHDVAKIRMPDDMRISELLQVIQLNECAAASPQLGDKVYVVGYPYGFSAGGTDQPTAIALTRFVASHVVPGRKRQILLDSAGAPSMSGGPAFVTDRPIGATHDRLNGATCRPRKTGLERGVVSGVFRGLGNR